MFAHAGVGDPDELGSVAKRQRTQEQRIDDAEHRGTRADADAGDQNREHRESRMATHAAQRVTQVLREVSEPPGDPYGACDFDLLGHISKLSARCYASFACRHDLGDQILHHRLDVKLHLFRQLTVPRAAIPPIADPPLKSLPAHCANPEVNPMIRATAPVTARYRADSPARCLRPSGVSL